MNAEGLVPLVVGLQFAVFGWRINREISLDDEGRKTWLLVSDYINLASMLSVLAFCIIFPVATGIFSKASRVSLAIAFVLTIFYPIMLAGHYRLFFGKGRSEYLEKGLDVPHVTDQEGVLLAVALIAAALAAYFVLCPE
jgi:hypothetical protein